MRLRRDRAQLLLVDLQERLLPKIQGSEPILASARKMIRAAQILRLPITLTEQYPKGLGKTHTALASLLPDLQPIVKLHFSCPRHEGFLQTLAGHSRQQIILVGIETHVCVQQTALDLLAEGYHVFVCADAVGSRREFDYDVALLRMQADGAVITTTEAAIFELLDQAGTDEFKQVLDLIKQDQ
jgi:nicotinamidase-related amidase